MNLSLKKISTENWEECITLSVSENQKGFVADNAYSLLQSKFVQDQYPLAIYDGADMVGFVMYGTDPETNRMEMSRLMIDQKHQGKGYGKAATQLLLEQLEHTYGRLELFTSAEPENVSAIRLYENLGFEKTGEVMWGEIVLKRHL
ncbi:GNAT family N-acetyltransferase [Rossellomorea vietnamensis]|uniref:GNAT family N-acetyltransferase n=1 Tax=Rossellomorea vietnamensis TaxID=218284 RepID=UPI001E38B721|nr:GNAT family N-acetyltransferase [Rossellomorea vietnamensis]MCC5801237.1 GNAT family N-acetyltransferase [Rossellomorea vietnamensis]